MISYIDNDNKNLFCVTLKEDTGPFLPTTYLLYRLLTEHDLGKKNNKQLTNILSMLWWEKQVSRLSYLPNGSCYIGKETFV